MTADQEKARRSRWPWLMLAGVALVAGTVIGAVLAVGILVPKPATPPPVGASEFSAADRLRFRTALEKLRYELRAGPEAPPFAEAIKKEDIERAIAEDEKKERLLRERCRFEISDEMIQTEVDRMKSDYRHPELILKIAAALDEDPRAIVLFWIKPILVDRYLRACVADDPALNAEARRRAEALQAQAATAGFGGLAAERVTLALSGEETEPEDREALARLAPGQISEVIETPFEYHILGVAAKTGDSATVDKVTVPKPDFDEWLKSQP